MPVQDVKARPLTSAPGPCHPFVTLADRVQKPRVPPLDLRRLF